MPALIQIAARILITIVVGSLSFLGYETGNPVYTASSTPEAIIDTPIVVTIKEVKSNTVPKVVATKPVSQKASTDDKQDLKINKKIINPSVPTIPSATEKPSLKNLPIPKIESLNPESSQVVFEEKKVSSIEDATVNIICFNTKGNMVSITTGSGVFVSDAGYILTNAHIGGIFLLKNNKGYENMDCGIRGGQIAKEKYKANLVYINKSWLEKNAGILFAQSARGTGEDDFAILATIGNDKTPAVEINSSTLNNNGKKIFVAGYPAESLGAMTIKNSLPFKNVPTQIKNIFTFSGSGSDIFETNPNEVAEHGSSGGGAFDESSKLIGIIVSTNANKSLNALSTNYIEKRFKDDSGEILSQFVKRDKNTALANFEKNKSNLLSYVSPFIK